VFLDHSLVTGYTSPPLFFSFFPNDDPFFPRVCLFSTPPPTSPPKFTRGVSFPPFFSFPLPRFCTTMAAGCVDHFLRLSHCFFFCPPFFMVVSASLFVFTRGEVLHSFSFCDVTIPTSFFPPSSSRTSLFPCQRL